MTDPRLVTAARVEEDAQYEAGLRPRALDDYIGQDRVRENLQVSIAAARQRGEALDHVLLYGPPGLGKTTLAYVIAHELGTAVRATSGPVLEKPGDLAAILTNLAEREVLFIDEIHRMSPVIEEILYPALEDYELDIMIGQGPSARSVKVPLQQFTLIGATTRAGLLTSPLRSRFGIVHRLEFYAPGDLEEIVRRSARILNVPIEDPAAAEISRRSRGTPRIANRLLRRVRDYAQVRADGRITLDVARAALEMLEVDEHGFDEIDRKLLPTKIASLATYVPPKILSNADLEKMVETSDDWIMQRVGIRERHIVDAGVATSDLSKEAALAAIERAGLTPDDITLIVVGTVTPDMMFPSTACLIQNKIGAHNAWGFD